MAQSIAVVRGAFNPPTTGHKCVLERLKGFDKILVVPLLADSHGREMLSYSKRCEMLKLFVEDTQIPGVEMYAVESEINPHGDPVTVVILLEHLKATFEEDTEITFVIGPEQMQKFPRQRGYERIAGEFNILVSSERSMVRSEFVREKVCRNIDITEDTTPAVAAYIANEKLYEDLNHTWTVD
ncbi:hypothetical protein P3447_08380 [Vibrio parahaemolyticus]|nr:hypothetical protein [Vibrio parahaemolyticus]